VANQASGDVSMYSIDAGTGVLTSLGKIAAGTDPVSVTVDSSGRFLYVANQINNISRYTIDPTRDVSVCGYDACRHRAHVSGARSFWEVRLCGDVVSNNILMYTVDTISGALTSTGTIAAGMYPYPVVVDPSGKFAYVANGNSNDLGIYTIDATTGALAPAGQSPQDRCRTH